ncbi:MAG: hypothetical protein WCS94_22770 [Verrucomicrobiota bacterium]
MGRDALCGGKTDHFFILEIVQSLDVFAPKLHGGHQFGVNSGFDVLQNTNPLLKFGFNRDGTHKATLPALPCGVKWLFGVQLGGKPDFNTTSGGSVPGNLARGRQSGTVQPG